MASFSVCLQDTCANELSLLRTFDAHTELFDEHVLLNAIYRYENHWLPMQVGKYGSVIDLVKGVFWMYRR